MKKVIRRKRSYRTKLKAPKRKRFASCKGCCR